MIFLQSRRAHTSSCTRHADVTAHDTHDIESARRTHAIAHATPHRARMQPPAPAATSSPAATATASPAATATAATATPSLTPKRRTRRTSNHAVSPPLDKLSEKPKLEACRAKDGGGREETRRVRRPHPAPAALPVGSRRVANDAGARRGFETRSSCSHLSASETAGAKRRSESSATPRWRQHLRTTGSERDGERLRARGGLRLQQQSQATREQQPAREQPWQAQAKAGVVKTGSVPHADVKRKIRALAGGAGDCHAVCFAAGRLLRGILALADG